MPERYRREVQRIMQAGSTPINRELDEFAGELESLTSDAEAGGHNALAYLIRMALAEAQRQARRDGTPD